jgi:hypothetical protein
MEAARDLASTNDLQGALQQEQKAAKGVTKLRENIERAAEQVLGSETEALRVARGELDRLLKEIDAGSREDEDAKHGAGRKGKPEPGEKAQPGDEPETAQAGKSGKEDKEASKEAKGGESSPDKSGEQKPGQEGKAGDEKSLAEGKGGESPGQTDAGGKDQAGGGKPGDQNGRPQETGRKLARNAGARGGTNDGGDEAGGWFFDSPTEVADTNPLTGGGYDRWNDRLRNVEELLETPELRNQAARIRDDARLIRIDHRRNDEPPKAAVLSARIKQPLAELRDRVAEELARRESANPLAPLDHDPVPSRFREQVRRYYTELGSGK